MKLGRLPRKFDPRVPHHGMMKAMLRRAGVARPALPLRCDNAASLPGDIGMMLNDQLGDCTCAGRYHLLQLVTRDAQGAELTEPDPMVLTMYRELGYRGGLGDQYDAASDQGCAEQDVLTYLLNTGSPMADGTRARITSYVEVDPENLDDVCEVIMEFGAAYIGFDVPAGFMEDVGAGATTWDAKPGYGAIEGGHCVILTGFDRSDADAPTFDVVSWGQKNFVMTAAFLRKYVDEVYAIADPFWVEKTGKTPYGLDPGALAGLASALREPGPAAQVDRGALEAARLGVTRDPAWPEREREFRAANPLCVMCDPNDPVARVGVQVHHAKVSFHVAVLLGRWDLELDFRNFRSLGECEGAGRDAPDHHLRCGHGGNFREDCNPAVDQAVEWFRGYTDEQIEADPRYAAMRAAMPPPWDGWTRDMKVAKYRELWVEMPPDPELVARYARGRPAPPPPDAWEAAYNFG